VPRSQSQEDARPVLREATIYNLLGDHPRIAQCLSPSNTDYVDVKYYPNGDLVAYLRKNKNSITSDLRLKWFRQIIEAVNKIHEHGVIHSDLFYDGF
jgi:serine/threonine protein kinase